MNHEVERHVGELKGLREQVLHLQQAVERASAALRYCKETYGFDESALVESKPAETSPSRPRVIKTL